MPSIDARLAPTFAAQLGLITRTQVLAAGGTDKTVAHRINQGRWECAERGVYALRGVPWTWRRHLGAVVLSVDLAFTSHRAAASLLGVGSFRQPPIELTVKVGYMPRRTFSARSEAAGVSVIVHQVEDHGFEQPRLVDGIPTCSPLRLAVDLGTKIPLERYQKVVGDLRRIHGITWPQLDELWRTHSRQGRDGCGPLHELLDRHFGAQGAPAEVIEARCAQVLNDAGLPQPVHQYEVQRPDGRTAILDLAYPELRIGIETEGRIHDWSEVRQADHTRRNNLQLLGWTIFHFTWDDVVHRPGYIARVLADAICARGRSAV